MQKITDMHKRVIDYIAIAPKWNTMPELCQLADPPFHLVSPSIDHITAHDYIAIAPKWNTLPELCQLAFCGEQSLHHSGRFWH
jgi:hypothetical protein